MAIDQAYDKNPQHGFGLRHLLVHEASHYFWRGNRAWIDEGIANSFADLFEIQVTGRDTYLERNVDGCDQVTIEDLDQAGAGAENTCSYHLATQLFREVYRELGPEQFYEGVRVLYAQVLAEAEVGVFHVMEAFAGVAEDVDAVEAIIDRWYYGDGNDS